MATQTTLLGGLADEIRVYYDRNLLSRLLPNLIWMIFGQSRPMPLHEGQSVNFRKFSSLSAATTPLTEGVTPTSETLTVSSISATPLQYGSFVEISDKLDMTAPDPILTEAGELLGEQAAETMDLIVRDVISAGTTLQYAAGRVSRVTVAIGDKLTAAEIVKAVRTLQVNKVKKMSSILNASTGVGTVPVNSAYIGIIGPQALYDLKADSKFVSIEKYGTQQPVLPFEVGAVDDVRFVMTDAPKVYTGAGAGGIDVYGTILLGQDAFGIIAPQGVQNIIKGFGAGQDPLNQRATSGWKAYFTAIILQQLAILRIEHAVSA